MEGEIQKDSIDFRTYTLEFTCKIHKFLEKNYQEHNMNYGLWIMKKQPNRSFGAGEKSNAVKKNIYRFCIAFFVLF
jgi:hypothetical protein